MRLPRSILSRTTPALLQAVLVIISLYASSSAAQSSLDNLDIPKCALQCFINALANDGCKSETDFECHCSKGNILSSAASCVDKGCNDSDQATAFAIIRSACKEVGVDIGNGDGNDGGSKSSSTMTMDKGSSTSKTDGKTSTKTPDSSTSLPSSSTSSSPSRPNTNPNPGPGNTISSPAPSTLISSRLPTISRPASTPLAMPTDTPLALLPTPHSLSPGVKAGISISVTVFASAILITIALYIRRLKRDLKAAKAAAGVPESVWRAHISTAAAPGPISRRKSWRGSRRGRSPPRSPLSPTGERDTEGGAVLKKKRGHVLSVVVERAEEEDSESTHRMVHEPVPGQKEGLADALELDGNTTEVVEAPTSITPKGGRTPSRGRSRDRGSSFGSSVGEAGPTDFAEKVKYG
ncbi:uncharacterized protein BDR25DRAFT_340298 [Lindgomyces ingoldianus]|uniref:Uncharacterized protein n=1 Tax=Lindgomyces ingoldianus TaxID=673940 RepID=A0ACB6R5F1_9PLEO|nr:uncharacterized protein BDR25DRAFT_340298 [Lindgomyces ingoldianus]KAF2474474.1 hypothetical protein BDR25DRAFT_340298 [Lindgomyces ingoldianus]